MSRIYGRVRIERNDEWEYVVAVAGDGDHELIYGEEPICLDAEDRRFEHPERPPLNVDEVKLTDEEINQIEWE